MSVVILGLAAALAATIEDAAGAALEKIRYRRYRRNTVRRYRFS